ncbi:MAG: hypothetical protein Q8O34_11020 [Rhodocyclaceae bacterium]|nr:hypothetical protein [Rhodocyclaceae bacterium]
MKRMTAPGPEALAEGCGYLAADNLLSGLEVRREYTASMISASR